MSTSTILFSLVLICSGSQEPPVEKIVSEQSETSTNSNIAQTNPPLQKQPASTGTPLNKQSHNVTYDFNENEPRTFLEQLLRTLFALAIVCLLAYFILSKLVPRLLNVPQLSGGGRGNPRILQIVERLTLEPRRSLFVIKTQEQYFLVGSSEKGIELLSRLEIEQPAKESSEQQTAPMPFLKYLLTAQQKLSEDKPNVSN